MDVVEYVGKSLLAAAGITVPEGRVAESPPEAADIARTLDRPVVLKSQVLAGGRGKQGAVRFAASPDEAYEQAALLLAADVGGMAVDRVLVEERVDVDAELYAGVLNDAGTKSPLVLFSASGGIDIEELADRAPDRLLRHPVDIRRGLSGRDAEEMIVPSGLPATQRTPVAAALAALYRCYRDLEAQLLEVNPLAVTRDGRVIALDCKLSLDPGSRPRHEDLHRNVEDLSPVVGTELERDARRQGLVFIELDGEVGVLANGAGLTMATLDAVHFHGGSPANFLEIGGDAYTKAPAALGLLLRNPRVRSLLVNFCGAFARTDVMAEGVVKAIEELRPELPISFTIHGTGEQAAVRIVRDRLAIEPHDRMDDAVREAVEAARAGVR